MSACSFIDIAAINNAPGTGTLDADVVNTPLYDADAITPATIQPGSRVTAATVDLDKAANLELKILAKIQERANEIHDQWVNSYLSCEIATLTMVANRPKEVVDIEAVFQAARQASLQAYAQATENDIRNQSQMCATVVCGNTTRLGIAHVRSASWQIQGDLRHAEVQAAALNAQRTNNRIAMIAPGRGGLASATNSLAAAARMYGELAAQANAAKGADGYMFGRALEFAKNNIGALSKLFGGSQPYQSNNGNPMYGPSETPTTSTGTDYLEAGGYLYDDPALLYTQPEVLLPPSETTPGVTTADIEFFYN